MRTRKTSLRRDNRGNFTREIGYLDQARTKQPKFNLGTDERQAEARIARLTELFSESMKACGGQPIWTGFALYAAKLISKGIYRIPYPPQWDTLDQIDHDLTLEDKAIEYVQMLRENSSGTRLLRSSPESSRCTAMALRQIVRLKNGC